MMILGTPGHDQDQMLGVALLIPPETRLEAGGRWERGTVHGRSRYETWQCGNHHWNRDI